jgi:hypothetical protein
LSSHAREARLNRTGRARNAEINLKQRHCECRVRHADKAKTTCEHHPADSNLHIHFSLYPPAVIEVFTSFAMTPALFGSIFDASEGTPIEAVWSSWLPIALIELLYR